MNIPLSTRDTSAPLGIFDSGAGGLTVVRAVRNLLPHEDIVYLGDTARVPYGNKSPATVQRFSREDCRFLLQHKVKMIIVACNTASAHALSLLEQEIPVPVLGMIEPGAQAASTCSRNNRIGVIGTAGTIASGSYPAALRLLNPNLQVLCRACPLLVPLVEEGWTDHPVTHQVLQEYLSPLLKEGIDTLLLGCTHYPLLKEALHSVVGPDVTLVDSAETSAQAVQQQLKTIGLLNPSTDPARTRIFVTDAPEKTGELARRFLQFDGGNIEKAVVD